MDLTLSRLSLVISVCLFIAWTLWRTASRSFRSKLRDLPGPPNASWLFGNLKEIYSAENAVTQERWTALYGNTIKYRGWLSVSGTSMLAIRILTENVCRGIDCILLI